MPAARTLFYENCSNEGPAFFGATAARGVLRRLEKSHAIRRNTLRHCWCSARERILRSFGGRNRLAVRKFASPERLRHSKRPLDRI